MMGCDKWFPFYWLLYSFVNLQFIYTDPDACYSPVARFGTVRFVNGTILFENDTVCFVNGTVRFLHGTPC